MKKMRPRRGFTLIAVIFMFIVIGAAVAAMAVLFATENRRTMGTRAGAQLRQLLLASVPFAEAELQSRGTTVRIISLDTPVRGAKVTLTIQPVDEGKARVRVDAVMGKSAATQTLRYVQSGGLWGLESSVLHADGSRIK